MRPKSGKSRKRLLVCFVKDYHTLRISLAVRLDAESGLTGEEGPADVPSTLLVVADLALVLFPSEVPTRDRPELDRVYRALPSVFLTLSSISFLGDAEGSPPDINEDSLPFSERLLLALPFAEWLLLPVPGSVCCSSWIRVAKVSMHFRSR